MPDHRDNPLDQEVNTEFMRVCKCVIPYLDTSIQKNVAIGLKFLELMNTINAFSENSTFSTNLSLTRQGRWEQDLLRNVRSNLSPEKAYIIDALIKLQEFRSILNAKDPRQETPPNPVPPTPSAPPSPSDLASFFTPPPASEESSSSFEAFEPFNPNETSSYNEPNEPNNSTHTFTPPPPPPPPPPQSNNSGPSPANIIQMLSPLLDDNQRQMLNLFSTFMGK